MSFESSQLSYGHLVTYPSVWLPPPNTVKIMLLGHTQQDAENYIQLVQTVHPAWDWAFYCAPLAADCNKEHTDWILINGGHMHAVVAQISDILTMALVLGMHSSSSYCISGQHEMLDTILEFSGHALYKQPQEIFDKIVQNHTPYHSRNC